MWKTFGTLAPLWDAEAEGGSGAAGGGSDAADGAEATEAASEAAEKPESESILDFGTKQEAGEKEAAKGDEWKAPEGLPDHLRGADAGDTLAKVLTAYNGARKELSQRKPGASSLDGAVPESPDGYVFEATGDDDKIAAELNSEESKPIVDAFKAAAHKLGIPDKAFAALMREGLAGVDAAGIPIGASNEDAQRISGEAELQKLSTMAGGAKEAGTIVNTLSGYGEKLVQRGIISKEDLGEFRVMAGTAESAMLFYRIITGELGEKPMPLGDGMDASVTPTAAYAAYSAAQRLPEGAERAEGMRRAQEQMQKAFGNDPGGAIRSSVL